MERTCTSFVERMFLDYPNHELFQNSKTICLSMYSGEDCDPRGEVIVDEKEALSQFKEYGIESSDDRECDYANLVYTDNRAELEMMHSFRYPSHTIWILLTKDPAVIAKLKEEYPPFER